MQLIKFWSVIAPRSDLSVLSCKFRDSLGSQLLKHKDLNAAHILVVIILAMHAAYVIPVAADGNFPLLSFSFV